MASCCSNMGSTGNMGFNYNLIKGIIMKLPYKKALEASTLYRAGVDYYAYGVLKVHKTAMFDYYKADKVTEEQQQTIREFCKDVQFTGVRSEYAPELKGVCIMFPKAGWYRNPFVV